MAGEIRHQISVMMSGHSLRVRVMRTGPVMMSDIRLCITMMMMRVLSLVLLKAHQALGGIEIRIASEVIGVLVNVTVYVAVEVSVNATIHRRRFMMMLIRIQYLLNILQLVFARVLLLR